MQRRTFIASAGTVVGGSTLSGCLGVLGGESNPNVVLGDPGRPFDSADVAYPAWGEQLPDVTLPAPLESRELELGSIARPRLLTFFYSNCRTVCPVLISALRNIQTHAADNGYADAVAFLPVTFDPERDTADRLQTYAEERNVATDAGNWHFLRPESAERARVVVEEEFGVAFRRTHPDDMDGYMFTHTSLTLLVNADGYVERAYRDQSPDVNAILADLERVRQA
ncbi:SCO family protein [Haloarchaeobius iranensis]|uniref:Protein SCO1/2 n=1 Tax=Haloarchaeobius iranensis TaxID=996166 RepID=A0A1G9ZC26_9EURY|nr:SCO family protein [Haloarchaeobius iranensis]SDN18942.1 protein SCO1/2 [Haloarchaeobius iranensis]